MSAISPSLENGSTHAATDAESSYDPNVRAREILLRVLREEGSSFDFTQAVRLLHRLQPDKSAVGEWAHPDNEVAKFVVPPSLAFPPSEIDRIGFDDTVLPSVSVRFFGLTGTQGVLPHTYTEHASARARVRDTAFRDFLDLFHHRAISLFYRAWERHRPALPRERGEDDRLLAHLLDLSGYGTQGLAALSQLEPETLATYAGLLSLRTRPAVGLAQMVEDHFGVRCSIEQFVGEWHSVRGGGQLEVGADSDVSRLGFGVVGDAVFDTQAGVRLRIGPLSRNQFNDFLPGGSAHGQLRALALAYTDAQLGTEVQLVLDRNAVPACTLDEHSAPKLGFGTWLRNRPPQRDPDDVTLTLA